MSKKVIKLTEAKSKSGLSRSSIYAMMKAGNFPKSIKIGTRSVGWLESDIDSWIDSRIAYQQAA